MRSGIVSLCVKLMIIAATAGLLLGVTNEITKDPIARQAVIAAENARKAVCGDADGFTQVQLPEDALVDDLYTAQKGGETIGYISQITVKGFSGEIEIIVGLDTSFVVTGVSIGGSNFSETAGLGAKAKEDWFSEQYAGLMGPITLNEDVDAITAATITSEAVNDGINALIEYVTTFIEGGGIDG